MDVTGEQLLSGRYVRHRPGQSSEILIVNSVEEFDEQFTYFIQTVGQSKFPVVAFNAKLDVNVKSKKQKNKINVYQRNSSNSYSQSSFYDDDFAAQTSEPEHVREIRTAKEISGNIAIMSFSNLCGVTLQVRTCLMPRRGLPERLKTFLECKEYLKVGFGIRKDMYRLWGEEMIHLNQFVDLRNILIRWSHLRANYHFRRMGTYSMASYLFQGDFHNINSMASASDWYAPTLSSAVSRGLANQTQLDIDILAQSLVLRFGGDVKPAYCDFDWLDQHKQLIDELAAPYINAPFDKTSYNFAYAPPIVEKFILAQCQALGSHYEPVAWTDKERDKSLKKKFGAQPLAAVDGQLLERALRLESFVIVESVCPETGERSRFHLEPLDLEAAEDDCFTVAVDYEQESGLDGVQLIRKQNKLLADHDNLFDRKKLSDVNGNDKHADELSEYEDELMFQKLVPKTMHVNCERKKRESEDDFDDDGLLDMESLRLSDQTISPSSSRQDLRVGNSKVSSSGKPVEMSFPAGFGGNGFASVKVESKPPRHSLPSVKNHSALKKNLSWSIHPKEFVDHKIPLESVCRPRPIYAINSSSNLNGHKEGGGHLNVTTALGKAPSPVFFFSQKNPQSITPTAPDPPIQPNQESTSGKQVPLTTSVLPEDGQYVDVGEDGGITLTIARSPNDSDGQPLSDEFKSRQSLTSRRLWANGRGRSAVAPFSQTSPPANDCPGPGRQTTTSSLSSGVPTSPKLPSASPASVPAVSPLTSAAVPVQSHQILDYSGHGLYNGGGDSSHLPDVVNGEWSRSRTESSSSSRRQSSNAAFRGVLCENVQFTLGRGRIFNK